MGECKEFRSAHKTYHTGVAFYFANWDQSANGGNGSDDIQIYPSS
jgi:hypothetical protein